NKYKKAYIEDNSLNTREQHAIVPRYSVLPLLAMLAMNGLAYFGTRVFTSTRFHYNIETPLDNLLPFVPAFIIIYLAAYFQWIYCYIRIGHEDKSYCYRIFFGEIIAKLLCLIIFMSFPTTLSRPDVRGSGIFERLVAQLYAMDAADNLFPSIHCLESWACYRGCSNISSLPEWFKKGNLIFTILVFASTVLLKQHVLTDIAGGVIVFEIGLILADVILKRVHRV
nr:hypothetical protein [Lachnospiraceae bacterium]